MSRDNILAKMQEMSGKSGSTPSNPSKTIGLNPKNRTLEVMDANKPNALNLKPQDLRVAGEENEDETQLPDKGQLFSRWDGLLETDTLKDYTVCLIGLGSVGADVLRYLGQNGFYRFIIADGDKLEIANVVRHIGGISDVGKLKTEFCKEFILNKNPFATVELISEPLDVSTKDIYEEVIQKSDLIINTTDDREAKQLCNLIALKHAKTVIYGGCTERAVGSVVLRVTPESACYTCFTSILPEQERNIERSSQRNIDKLGVAYSDRPVPIEPGLQLDIAPCSQMVAKLALAEALKDKESTLDFSDLNSDYYIFYNRRAVGQESEKFDKGLGAIDGLRLMRWYGVKFPKDANCMVCGHKEKVVA